MTERPIIFSRPMLQALLAGTKTQTWRVVKPQPVGEWAAPGKTACPYGVAGDALWVRESFAIRPTAGPREFAYRADVPDYELADEREARRIAPKLAAEYREYAWRPSIHMPRTAARILLRVNDVRVERVQATSQNDAIAEGCPASTGPFLHHSIADFRKLWDSINGERAPWDSNPWVWVVAFERISA